MNDDKVLVNLLKQEDTRFRLRCDHAYKPTWNRVGDVGLDLYAPGLVYFMDNLAIVKTGVFVEHIPDGFWLQLETPSKLASVGVIVTGGIIDTHYRGEIGVILMSLGMSTPVSTPEIFSSGGRMVYMLDYGDKIAQLVIRQTFYPSNFSINGEPVTPQTNEPRGANGGLWK